MNFLEDFTKEGKAIKDAIHLKNTQQFNPDPTASETYQARINKIRNTNIN